MLDWTAGWRPPRIFLFLVLALGLAFVILNPPFAVNDEDAHLARIFELSTGRLHSPDDIQGEYQEVPADYLELTGEYVRINPPGDEPRVRPSRLWQQLRAGAAQERARFPGRAGTYVPFCYMTQIPVIWLLRHFDLSGLVHLYAARIASLAGYALLAWLAVVTSAQLQWIFIVIALTPIALIQAAGVSADGTVIGLSLLFFALAGKAVALGATLSRRELWLLALSAIVLTSCKPVYLMVVLCLPALFWTKPEQRRRIAAALITLVVVAAGLYGAWSASVPATHAPPDPTFNATRQLELLRENPWQLLLAAYKTLVVYGDNLLIQSVFMRGRVSNMIRFPSAIAVVVHLQLAIGLALGSLVRGFPGDARARRIASLWFLLAAATTVLVVSAALYVCCTEVGADRTRHLQGRYFLPAVPAFLLALALLGKPLWARWLRAGSGLKPFFVITFNNLFCLFSILGFHYFPARVEWPL